MSALIVTVCVSDTFQPSQVNNTTVSDALTSVFTRAPARRRGPQGRTKSAATRSQVVRIAGRDWVGRRFSTRADGRNGRRLSALRVEQPVRLSRRC
jgi:hypothetical protein